jgi:polyvinyl alcohol dehydrogenase (cytochrome)
MTIMRSRLALKFAIALSATLLLFTMAWAVSGNLWTSAGQNPNNTRHAKTENKISPENVSDLSVRWVVTTGGDVSATPAVDGEHVYVPDWAGNLFKIDRETGEMVWSRQVSEYTGIAGDFARTTPAIHGDKLILGNQGGRFFAGATLMAVHRETGDLLWSTQLDNHPASIVTQSPIVFGNTAYVGVSSAEELFAAVIPDYPCCTFRGSVVALNVNTGDIIWKTYTVPDLPDYSGGAVWGGTPVADNGRNSLYVTTGNNYSLPTEVLDCVAANEGDPDAVEACIAPDDFFDSILALDLGSGAVKWSTRALPFDAWNVDCLFGSTGNCPDPSGPAFDFGEGPVLFTVKDGGGKKRELLGAGQKSGQYWTVDPDTGQVVWVTQSGPGGVFGGLIWGSAVDGERIYVANANSDLQPWTLIGGETIQYGFWGALDAGTGEILWQTPDPIGAVNQGPVTIANGVVYACSLDVEGHMYAMDAATGEVLWGFASGGSCNSGAALVDGTVYWGSGYASLAGLLPPSTGNNKLYAFDIPVE